MKDGLRFVDCDMHIMEPPDLFERYLDPKFRERVILPVGADGRPRRGTIVIDGLPTTRTPSCSSTASARRPGTTHSTQPLSGSRLADTGRLDFAIERDYDAVAQVMGMAMEGVDIAVLFPTTGLSLIARDHLDPWLSLGLCQAYNNWIARLLPAQPGAAQVRGDAARPRRAPGLPRAAALRPGPRSRRLVRAPEPRERPLLALELLGPALQPARGAGRDLGVPRGHRRLVLAHERPLRREPLLPPRGQPLDRDAAGPDRHDRRRRVRVPPEAAGGLPGGPELVGARACCRGSSGTIPSTATRTPPTCP